MKRLFLLAIGFAAVMFAAGCSNNQETEEVIDTTVTETEKAIDTVVVEAADTILDVAKEELK